MNTAKPAKPKPFLTRLGLPLRGPRIADCADASGLPVDADAPAKRRDIPAIGRAVAELAGRLGIGAEAADAAAEADGAVIAAWRAAAGDLADRLVPEKYVGGILYVVGGSTAELFEIRRSRLPAIEKKARALAPFAKLRQIRIKSAPPRRTA